jgi:hypothetical protein
MGCFDGSGPAECSSSYMLADGFGVTDGALGGIIDSLSVNRISGVSMS